MSLGWDEPLVYLVQRWHCNCCGCWCRRCRIGAGVVGVELSTQRFCSLLCSSEWSAAGAHVVVSCVD
eukprot:4587354-Karenia_brevis.AAC.1